MKNTSILISIITACTQKCITNFYYFKLTRDTAKKVESLRKKKCNFTLCYYNYHHCIIFVFQIDLLYTILCYYYDIIDTYGFFITFDETQFVYFYDNKKFEIIISFTLLHFYKSYVSYVLCISTIFTNLNSE